MVLDDVVDELQIAVHRFDQRRDDLGLTPDPFAGQVVGETAEGHVVGQECRQLGVRIGGGEEIGLDCACLGGANEGQHDLADDVVVPELPVVLAVGVGQDHVGQGRLGRIVGRCRRRSQHHHQAGEKKGPDLASHLGYLLVSVHH